MFIYENEAMEEEMRAKFDEDDPFREQSNTISCPPQKNMIEESKTRPRKSNRIQVRDSISLKKPGRKLKNENSQQMAEICCKLRTSYLLYISMILLSFLIKKFEYIRPLLNNLQQLIKYANEKATGEDHEKPSPKIDDKLQSLASIQIYLKSLKDISNSLLNKAIEKQLPDDSKSDSSDDDPFLKNLMIQAQDNSEEAKKKMQVEEEEKNAKEKSQRKLDQFMILWLRQIVIYNTHYVLHLAMTNSNMTSLLDVRPSIVKATNIRYALISLMNPRLQSLQQVNNFKSMKRVLDNIITYFFQNFLTPLERSKIIEDLQKIQTGTINIRSCKHLKFNQFFESEEEFKKFCSFMDMKYYIGNVCEFELSLIKHTNKDYSSETLKRVQDVYKNGIEVYKNTGEHIPQF
jgi:hypothetical protein